MKNKTKSVSAVAGMCAVFPPLNENEVKPLRDTHIFRIPCERRTGRLVRACVSVLSALINTCFQGLQHTGAVNVSHG